MTIETAIEDYDDGKATISLAIKEENGFVMFLEFTEKELKEHKKVVDIALTELVRQANRPKAEKKA